MLGFLFCVIAGAAMSVQGVMNTRLGAHIGAMEANALVQWTAALLSLLPLAFARGGGLAALGGTPKLYWCGGVLGLVITLTVMLGIRALSPTVAVSVILITQLLVAAGIDALGLMESEKVAFRWPQIAGAALMIGGVLLFRFRRT
jgi:transporter family-2 protein